MLLLSGGEDDDDGGVDIHSLLAALPHLLHHCQHLPRDKP